MRVLVACEYSATVRDAFRARGHDAWSCDLLPTEGDPRWHIQGDVLDAIAQGPWDLIIIHIPCTGMAVCGNKHYAKGAPKHQERLDAIEWSIKVWDAACMMASRVAMENGASVLFPVLRKERKALIQYAHPWQFGHPEQKKTGFAMRGLLPLRETNNVYEHMMTLPKHIRERVHYMSPGPDRGKERARFYQGFADAMAMQWGSMDAGDNEEARYRRRVERDLYQADFFAP